jgi:hypothetical protein
MMARRLLALALDPTRILRAQGLTADPWQRDLLLSTDRQVLLNCSRQSGKSTTVAALALHTALFRSPALVLILSPGLRQSGELFRKVKDAYNALNRPSAAVLENNTTLELANGSRIVSLPGKESTIRSYSNVALLLLDEASRVVDELYRSVRPMLAVSQGRLIALSTPFGQRGFFWHEWLHNTSFKKVKVTWHDCPRITPAFIAQERASLGDQWVRQEYECSFEALAGLVYPDFHEQAVIDLLPPTLNGRLVGGLDFGWRNPFAALWSRRDHDDVLTLIGERYLRQTPLHEHAQALRQQPGVMWYADPAGATEIAELRSAGLAVRRGDNDIRLGIAAVSARLRTGRLKVLGRACPNLPAEARLYRYPTANERGVLGENPVDENNHALAALRYLVSKLDSRFIARLRQRVPATGPLEIEQRFPADEAEHDNDRPDRVGKARRRWEDPALWETLE